MFHNTHYNWRIRVDKILLAFHSIKHKGKFLVKLKPQQTFLTIGFKLPHQEYRNGVKSETVVTF